MPTNQPSETNNANNQTNSQANSNPPQVGSTTPALQNGIDAQKREREKQHKAMLKKRRQEVEERKSLIDHLTQRAKAPAAAGRQSTMEKAQHLAGLTAEGVAGEIIVNLVILGAHLILPISYAEQRVQWEVARNTEMLELLKAYLPDEQGNYPVIYQLDKEGNLLKDKPIFSPDAFKDENDQLDEEELERVVTANNLYTKPHRLVYTDEGYGTWPTIYETDPATGKINYEKTYKPGDAPDYAVYANGLIPKPSFGRGLQNAITYYKESMLGESWVSPVEKLCLWGALNVEAHAENGPDKAADLAAQRFSRPIKTA